VIRFLLLVLLVFSSAAAIADPFPAAPHVYVQGSAEIRVQPDTARLWLGIEATDLVLATAKSSVDERTRKLIASCKALGIADEDISSTSLQIGPEYDYNNERKFIGTKVRRDVELILHDLNRYSDLVQAIVAAQVGEITSIEMSSSRGNKVIEEAQQKALADARARAGQLAAASGQALGAAYSISEFDLRQEERYQLTPSREIGKRRGRREMAYFASVAADGSEPFQPGTIVATATVYVIYLLESK
jgi:uncharacterized protein YggE